MAKRRTEISIETHEIMIIRTRGGKRENGFCKFCQTVVPTFTAEKLAYFLKIAVDEVCRLVKTEQIHLIDSQCGGAFICGNSIKILSVNRGQQ